MGCKCMTWRDPGAEGPERVGERSEARVDLSQCPHSAFAFVSLIIIKSHRPHLPSLSISARLFFPGNVPIELPAEEARTVVSYRLDPNNFSRNDLSSSIEYGQTLIVFGCYFFFCLVIEVSSTRAD